MIDYNNKYFKPLSSSQNSETSGDTIFHYRQKDDLLHATYSGGSVRFGQLIGKVDENGKIDMCYQHLNNLGKLKTGTCKSIPEIDSSGKIILHENWQWTSGDASKGSSILIEIDPVQ